ncbi:MAG: hypothetical protein F6K28_14085 [Microcoleus sp. SIO2G3]|nr:hypothetical protein [Microcoleus sp. SIO2G3]
MLVLEVGCSVLRRLRSFAARAARALWPLRLPRLPTLLRIPVGQRQRLMDRSQLLAAVE